MRLRVPAAARRLLALARVLIISGRAAWLPHQLLWTRADSCDCVRRASRTRKTHTPNGSDNRRHMKTCLSLLACVRRRHTDRSRQDASAAKHSAAYTSRRVSSTPASAERSPAAAQIDARVLFNRWTHRFKRARSRHTPPAPVWRPRSPVPRDSCYPPTQARWRAWLLQTRTAWRRCRRRLRKTCSAVCP